MRELRQKSKIAESVGLPANLVSFLTEVHRQILAGDEETLIPSDDLIQNDFACGGLIEENGATYEFTFFPENGREWKLMLNKDEIEKIAGGKIGKLELFACRDANCGSKFYDSDAACFDCDWMPVS